jgi:hypothetical protein
LEAECRGLLLSLGDPIRPKTSVYTKFMPIDDLAGTLALRLRAMKISSERPGHALA